MFKTEQETFWAGELGDDYIDRNKGAELLASNLNFFTKALSQADPFKTCIEFGENIGINLKALQLLYPHLKTQGVEINPTSAKELSGLIGENNVFSTSIFDIEFAYKNDPVFPQDDITWFLLEKNLNLIQSVSSK
ncbi:MAG: spore coat polysaccharide biosynthesis protein SpsF [Crocinitomicaceae bacterium]|jgi:spore coat polysaccharide biosynthesis protein SpsF